MTAIEKGHYVIHEKSGLPVRIPAHLKREMRVGSTRGEIQVRMIATNPLIGNRSPGDTVEQNFPENIRLRKMARVGSHRLVAQAEEWGIERYCTIVHGSLARGLVR